MTTKGNFCCELPMVWNGKLVVGGASGTRSEFNGDLVISDYVLQKGYAYASQNKGTLNSRLSTKSDPNACPLSPVSDSVPGSASNPLIYFPLLDNENSLAEWGERIDQAALIAKALIEEHYKRKPSRTYAMGVSNGGYQVRKAIEDHAENFDGGVAWEAVLWQLTYSRIGSSAALLRPRVSVLGGEVRSKTNLNRPNARTCLSPSPNAQIIDNVAVIYFAQSAGCAHQKVSSAKGQ